MISTCQKLTVQLLYNWGHLDKYYFPSLHGCQCFSEFPLWVQSVNTFSNASYWGCFPPTKLNKFLSNSSKTVIREVICQKRVRVFHQGFQTPRNRWKHEAAGWVHAFIVSRCLEPLMKHEAQVFDMTSQTSVRINSGIISEK